ncbi:hypothetical protein FAM09_07075 [Niastella caeni]|uniref:Uncharacterized protein n=1 Tax=Niastella caeni TaxID=2569763 RepID=A0A4S8I1P0_9BACT|nr:hypothetical protein [Niastella caeni]THU41855.1 hypothetical protein FAM09_07075 [Niastella caeni]
MIDVIASRNLVQTICKKEIIINSIDREQLTRAYADGLLRLNQIIRLLFTLEKKGLILLQREQGKDTVNVCLNEALLKNQFFNKELFKLELANLKVFNSSIQRITQLTLENLLIRMFDNHGIKRWASSL